METAQNTLKNTVSIRKLECKLTHIKICIHDIVSIF